MTNVGFAGIGMMGHGMVSNLVKAGFAVFVYNRTRSKAESVKGATVVEKASDLCNKADVIFTCVSNDAALTEVLFGSSGIFSTLNGKNILVDCSTVSVAITTEIAKKCSEKNAKFLDAPVTGGKKGAQEGTLMFMIGGEKEAFEKIKTAFEAMGKRLVYCGLTPNGQMMKHALNLTQAMVLECYLEGLALSLKGGVPKEAALEVLNNSGARSNVADSKMPAILKGDFQPNFYYELMNKDLGLAEQSIKKHAISLPLAEAMIANMRTGMPEFAKEDWVAIAKLVERKAKTRF